MYRRVIFDHETRQTHIELGYRNYAAAFVASREDSRWKQGIGWKPRYQFFILGDDQVTPVPEWYDPENRYYYAGKLRTTKKEG